MRFTKNLEIFFIVLVALSLSLILYNWYQSHQFDTKPVSEAIQKRVKERESRVLSLIREKYGLEPDIPLIVSDQFHSRLYGLTGYKEGEVRIYLNKKRFKESSDYMVDEVIPHEYAHAMLFLLGKKTPGDGHTKLWNKICLELDGRYCERYVDNEEIVRQKMGL